MEKLSQPRNGPLNACASPATAQVSCWKSPLHVALVLPAILSTFKGINLVFWRQIRFKEEASLESSDEAE